MNIEFLRRQRIAANIYSFFFSKPPAFKHVAGEYVELSLDVNNTDERGNRHWFTVASSPTEAELMFTTKLPTKHQRTSSFKQHLLTMTPGDKAQISPPMGDFVLPKTSSQPLLFVAGGIGITPFRSMAKYIQDKKLSYPIQLIYAASKEEEFVFTELLGSIFDLTQVVSKPSKAWTEQVGHLNAAKLSELVPALDEKLIYLSGPKPMVKSLQDQLIASGIAKHLVKIDDFPGYTDI